MFISKKRIVVLGALIVLAILSFKVYDVYDGPAREKVFDDAEGRMNLSVAESGGALLVVSQFTLHGDVRRGRRPSWFEAAPPELAETLYEFFVAEARRAGARVETGSFRRMMEVELVNDGPVTILLDSRKLF